MMTVMNLFSCHIQHGMPVIMTKHTIMAKIWQQKMSTDLDSFTMTEKEGLYKAVFSRRDVRSHFIDKQIPDDILVKVLNAAHHAPSGDFHNPGILY